MKSKNNKGATTAALTLLITSGMLASALGIRQVNKQDLVTAWVVNKNMSAGQVVSVHDIAQKDVNPSNYTNMALSIQNPRAFIGKQLATNKMGEQPLFETDFMQVKSQNLSEAIPAGRVLYTLKLNTLDIPLSRVHKGDRLDIVAKTNRLVRTVARDVQLIGISKGPGSKAQKNGVMDSLAQKEPATSAGVSLVLAVLPKDVYSLAAIDTQDKVSIIVHSAYDIEQGRFQNFSQLQTSRTIQVVKGVKNQAVYVAK
ncbi:MULTISPECIES: hypothetical protein [unclassified Pseudoalteromonas]|uniref:hypothetical protein n=1 Tax=unclassified Pseudoalteromonas TaxID=194690 RepID=UPI00235962E7|nr:MULTISPECIES: hypothetical protein [unclassified Pseudoalteromonas]MDC9565545.1 hypothetical protein [Pseudoalteromonas sp. GAB2316C]MDC9569876.1 hypothetical protein [Pseudoalteromonas sp. GABNB9D]MDC9573987.1 hypothetical protein [Pseudoalteromonas sp. GABNS16A]MDC9578393.1 hypothetical protein [Pseudoalteromonas sp. GABNS16E]MDC9585989.1 hypothetical protein [Pseudoalteromonas sp. GABNS16C]